MLKTERLHGKLVGDAYFMYYAHTRFRVFIIVSENECKSIVNIDRKKTYLCNN